MNDISTDPDRLKYDKGVMEESIRIICLAKHNIDNNIAELMAIWKGQSAEAFFKSFLKDSCLVDDIVRELTELTEWLGYACDVYKTCEDRAISDVEELRLA